MAEKRTTAELNRLTMSPVTHPEIVSPDFSTPSVGLPVSGIDKIIAKIRNRICGRVEVEEEWWCINLSRDEFKAFEARFEAERNFRWPKYDYFPQLAKFVLLVQESEASDQARKRRRGSDEVLEGRSRQKMVKQKTFHPSSEKLTTSNEERFKAAEEEIEKQLSSQDGDYISE
ncbi:hypothetical protein VTI28DRAFT_573 [Corynascus sepedonium]